MVKIIAELSINHLGMKKIAMAMIERCHELGADYIKLKKKNVKDYYKPGKKWREYDFIDYRQSLELSNEDFIDIDTYCKEIDMPWFSTVHDLEGLRFLSTFDPPFYKVASMDARNREFLGEFLNNVPNNRPIIVSTGGMDISEISNLVKTVTDFNLHLILNHCVSIYPTDIGQTNIHMLNELHNRFASDTIKIGYSGHEIGWMPTIAAVLLGAEYIERHVTLSRDIKIHHIDASLTMEEFDKMTQDIRHIEELMKAENLEYRPEELHFLDGREYT
jgi:N-acetylneuraminate synthase